jgi:hypothetical protein
VAYLYDCLPDGGIVINLSGDIVPGDADRFIAWAKENNVTNVTIFHLDSKGGNVGEAERFTGLAKNAITYVGQYDTCASSCFMIWAAGAGRITDPEARIGVHSASNLEGKEDASAMGVTLITTRELKEYGVPDAILGKLATTEPDSIYWLTPDEIKSMYREPPKERFTEEPTQQSAQQPTELHSEVPPPAPQPESTGRSAAAPQPAPQRLPHRYWQAECQPAGGKPYRIQWDDATKLLWTTSWRGVARPYKGGVTQTSAYGFDVTATNDHLNRTLTVSWTMQGAILTTGNGSDQCSDVHGYDK